MRKLQSIREDYHIGKLNKRSLSKNPIKSFKKWMGQALKQNVLEPTSFVLGTVDRKGKPSSRVVLLKGFDERGFHFYTNYNSKKAQDIEANPNVSMNFFWREIHRQVRVEGRVKKMTKKESAEYFALRPRLSQIGAWTSDQSETLKDRKTMSSRMKQLIKKFEKMETVPCPPHWGGYIIKPKAIEFWQGRQNRLHDRFRYELKKGMWNLKRLWP